MGCFGEEEGAVGSDGFIGVGREGEKWEGENVVMARRRLTGARKGDTSLCRLKNKGEEEERKSERGREKWACVCVCVCVREFGG